MGKNAFWVRSNIPRFSPALCLEWEKQRGNPTWVITELKFPEKSKDGRWHPPLINNSGKWPIEVNLPEPSWLFYNRKFISKQNIWLMSNTRGHRSTFLGAQGQPTGAIISQSSRVPSVKWEKIYGCLCRLCAKPVSLISFSGAFVSHIRFRESSEYWKQHSLDT